MNNMIHYCLTLLLMERHIFVNDNLSQIPRDYSEIQDSLFSYGSNLNYCSSDSLISSINNIIPQASNQGDFLNVAIMVVILVFLNL